MAHSDLNFFSLDSHGAALLKCKRMKINLVVVLIFLFGQTACSSSKILRDHEYERSMTAMKTADYAGARENFPAKEEAGFITSVEKSWIDFWKEDFNSSGVMKHTDAFEGRKLIRISKEAENFLMSESEEGYIPSEGEVAILHLVAAAHLIKEGQRESARVELKRVDETLNSFWDDPALRVWSAALWAQIGEWWEAQVDLRRAYEMTKNPKLKELAEGSVPQKLVVHFHGAGPELRWQDSSYTPEFVPPSQAPVGEIVIPTMPWYQRHLKRNHDMREVMVKSNYMAQYLGKEVNEGAQEGALFAATATLKVIAIGVGVAVVAVGVYALASLGASPGTEGVQMLGYAGLAIGGVIWGKASDFDESVSRDIRRESELRKKDLRIYRLVRFMPDFIELRRKVDCVACKVVTFPKHGPTEVTFVQSLN